ALFIGLYIIQCEDIEMKQHNDRDYDEKAADKESSQEALTSTASGTNSDGATQQKRGGGRGFAADPARAAAAGRKGGQMSSGNFKFNPARAAEAGRKGGQHSGGNFKNDPKRAAEAG